MRTPFSLSARWVVIATFSGICCGVLPAQQSGFQTDGTPIYQALPVPPTGVPPLNSPVPGQYPYPAPGQVPGQYPAQPQTVPPSPAAPGMTAPAANPDYPQLVYPPVYTPETQPRPPRAMPVPETPKKGKFGLFGKRKDKDNEAPDRSADTEPARVYQDPATAYPAYPQGAQGQMAPRPGFDPNYPTGAVPPGAVDAYGRPLPPGPDPSAASPQPGMQPRPALDSRYPVYTTQPVVPPSYPANPGTSVLPPLPDTPASSSGYPSPGYPQMTPAPAAQPRGEMSGTLAGRDPAAPFPDPAAPFPDPAAPRGPAMPPADVAPIFRREPVLEPAPAPPSASSSAPEVAASNAPIFRSGSSTGQPAAPSPPLPGAGRTESPQSWEVAKSGTASGQGGVSGSTPPARTETPAPPKPEADEFSTLPFAKPVAGKVGFVTLPTYSGEIDVRGIAPGTPVEIPDPSDATKTIQFRVP